MKNYISVLKENGRYYFYMIMCGVNVISLGLGFAYFISNKNNPLWNIYGLLILIAFLGNIRLSAIEERNKNWSYAYLTLSCIGFFVVMLINTLVSLNPTNYRSQNIVSVGIIFSLFLMGGMIAINNIMNWKNKIVSSAEEKESFQKMTIKRTLKYLIIIVLSLSLFCGLYLVYMLLGNRKLNFYEMFIPEYALFYGLIFLSLGVLIRKVLGLYKHFIYNSIILTITILIFMVCMLPFISVPKLLRNAEVNFEDAFGEEFKNNPKFISTYFRQMTFSLTEYFYGVESKGYQVQENILFYEGTEGVDQGLKLYFDVYKPEVASEELPGHNSVLIRIHGGGWTAGDKGIYNFSQMNKYFAERGYVVFDIQYGLCKEEKLSGIIPVAPTRKGDFTINDMVRHIGIFTNYLADHGEAYGANLDSVFISGGSAGGHLAITVGLGIQSGKYKDILDSRLQIKGLIPYYPGNGLSRFIGIDGKDEFVDPYLLVNENSLPCLIYQGDHDGLVLPIVSERFRYAYLSNNINHCAIISMPFGSHASDLYFAGYYNQVFLYYMERFMYQYK